MAPAAKAQGLAQAVEYQGDKALTLAQSRATEISSEEREGAHPGAQDQAEAVPAAQARVAPADLATREAAFQLGLQKTKTSWEF
jgi:hypothetical protein